MLTIELEAVALLAAFAVSVVLIVLTTASGLRERLAAVALGLVGVAWTLSEGVQRGMWWPALIVAGLIANRVGGLVTGALRAEDAKMRQLVETLGGFLAYVVAVGGSLAIAVPAFGAVPALPAEHARWCALPGELAADAFETTFAASWCREPHRALAAGAVYYLIAVWRDWRRLAK